MGGLNSKYLEIVFGGENVGELSFSKCINGYD